MQLSNQQARHVAIACSGLQNSPAVACNKNNLLRQIKHLGYVQLDPLKVVARAHDHILWSRNNNYQPKHLDALLENERLVFEHFSHDACVLPMDTLPYWKHQFLRKSERFAATKSRNNHLNKKEHQELLTRLMNEGPLSSKDFKVASSLKKRATWSKPAHKQTLDFLWLTGELAVSKRDKFIKYYDLAERVYPKKLIDTKKSDAERLTWLSTQALKKLGFGTISEVKHFWDASSLDETKNWFYKNCKKHQSISVESWNGELTDAVTLTTSSTINSPPALSKRIRIINPFDPIVRDRKRLERLFGFNYRIEIYVPPAKRTYGYYVYPLLEYDKFVGRLEVRHDRERNCLSVDNLWHEPDVKFGKQRMGKLHSELERLKRFCQADRVEWSK